ncbi:MAG: alpha-amylase family glycosyl hydrolase [Mycoplasmatales bacterium]
MENLIIYEIYIKSFKDSNNDGIGDLNGIYEKLSYLKEVGINTIWITPFYPSPQIDNGYDVSDYRSVAKEYGTIDDFKKLLDKAHDLDIRVVVDVVFNHCSDKHEWFLDESKKDYFIYQKEIPNNWESMFSGCAWEYDERYGEYYLHRFAKEQPDLNFTNKNVINEFKDILLYWLDIGIDGFRFDVINFFISDNSKLKLDNPKGEHIHDLNHEQTYEIIREFKQHLKSNSKRDFIFIGEVGSDDNETLKTYVHDDLMDFVFNFNISSQEKLDVNKIFNELKVTSASFEYPTVFFSSHDMSRFNTRLANKNDDITKLLLTLIFTYKGIPILFQGDEFAQPDIVANAIEQMVDIRGVNEYHELVKKGMDDYEAFKKAMIKNRDYSRGTLHWDETKYYGFSEVEPWIYNNDDDMPQSKQVELKDSVFNYTKQIIKLRNENLILQKGELLNLELISACICYQRQLENKTSTIILNFKDEIQTINYMGLEIEIKPYSYQIGGIWKEI